MKTIKYYLQPNAITPDPDDQTARVSLNGTLDQSDILDQMMEKGTMVTRTDALAVVNLFMRTVAREVAQGFSVNLPLANLKPSITGVFRNEQDAFDPSRHTVSASLSPGVELLQHMSAASVERTTANQPQPIVASYADASTKTRNTKLSPGGIGTITGEELKYEASNPKEGIYFVKSDKTETKVTVVASLSNQKLVFSVPATLAKGDYTVEVRRAYTKAKAIRVGRNTKTLTVA